MFSIFLNKLRTIPGSYVYMGDVFLYPWGWDARDTYLRVINVCLQTRLAPISFYPEERKILELREKHILTVLMSSRLSAPLWTTD